MLTIQDLDLTFNFLYYICKWLGLISPRILSNPWRMEIETRWWRILLHKIQVVEGSIHTLFIWLRFFHAVYTFESSLYSVSHFACGIFCIALSIPVNTEVHGVLGVNRGLSIGLYNDIIKHFTGNFERIRSLVNCNNCNFIGPHSTMTTYT